MAKELSAIKKLKLLITVVDREKGEFYMDVISQFPVNLQMLLSGKGTATLRPLLLILYPSYFSPLLTSTHC